jgi:hypothetical protein
MIPFSKGFEGKELPSKDMGALSFILKCDKII